MSGLIAVAIWDGRTAGLTFAVVDGELRIRGPKSAGHLAQAILDRKPDAIAYLEQACRSCYCNLLTRECIEAGVCTSCRTKGR